MRKAQRRRSRGFWSYSIAPCATISLKIEHPDRSLGLLYAGADAASPAETRFRQFIADRFLALTQRIMAKQREAVWRGSA